MQVIISYMAVYHKHLEFDETILYNREKWEKGRDNMKKTAAVFLAVLAFVMFALSASAAQISQNELSGTDISATDAYSTGVFIPCEYIPSFASVPDFYTPIESVTCMYMFVDADGNAHRRWYGSVDGAYGWYALEDGERTVRHYSMPVNTEKDREMLYKKTQNVYSTETDLGYYGILPPDEGRTAVSELFGMPVKRFLLWSTVLTAGLCLIIMLIAAAAKNTRGKRRKF